MVEESKKADLSTEIITLPDGSKVRINKEEFAALNKRTHLPNDDITKAINTGMEAETALTPEEDLKQRRAKAQEDFEYKASQERKAVADREAVIKMERESALAAAKTQLRLDKIGFSPHGQEIVKEMTEISEFTRSLRTSGDITAGSSAYFKLTSNNQRFSELRAELARERLTGPALSLVEFKGYRANDGSIFLPVGQSWIRVCGAVSGSDKSDTRKLVTKDGLPSALVEKNVYLRSLDMNFERYDPLKILSEADLKKQAADFAAKQAAILAARKQQSLHIPEASKCPRCGMTLFDNQPNCDKCKIPNPMYKKPEQPEQKKFSFFNKK